jgi:hypothetical protein
MATVLTYDSTLKKQTTGLKKENIVLSYSSPILIILGIILSISGYILYFIIDKHISGLYLSGIICLIIGIGQKFKTSENTQNYHRFKAGQKGEDFVLNILKQNLPDNYYILNDCNVSSGIKNSQIDHLILSENGIFVVETKNYSGYLSGNVKDKKITQIKKFKHKETKNKISNPVSQNEYHCEIFKRFLNDNKINLDGKYIHSIIIFANRYVSWNFKGDSDSIIGKIDNAIDYINKIKPDNKIDVNVIENIINKFVKDFKIDNANT